MGTQISKSQKLHERRLLRKITVAQRGGRSKSTKHFVCEYLNSYDAKMIATLRAFRAMARRRRPKLSQLQAIARSLDPWRGTEEPVVVHWRAKRSNPDEFRTVMNFGVENRALQYLVLPLLEVLADLHPHQYASRGGIHAAVERAAGLLKDGYHWAVEVDIKDCYSSFDGQKLQDLLPLPKEVTQHVITAECLHLVGGNIYEWFGPADEGDAAPLLADALANARRGIPQGSAASPIVAEKLLAHSLRCLPTVGEPVGYADNSLLMAKTEAEAVSMTIALKSALLAHPAGPLRPRLKFFRPGESIEFLGHRLTKTAGKVRIDPTAQNIQKFESTARAGLRRLKRTDLKLSERSKLIRELRGYIRCWTAAFPLCEGIASTRAQWLAKVPKA